MTEYVCPRCSDSYDSDNLWFIKNAGYIDLGICPECRTPDEFDITSKNWKTFLATKGIGLAK